MAFLLVGNRFSHPTNFHRPEIFTGHKFSQARDFHRPQIFTRRRFSQARFLHGGEKARTWRAIDRSSAAAAALAVHRQTWRNGSNTAGYTLSALSPVYWLTQLDGFYPWLPSAYESTRAYPSLYCAVFWVYQVGLMYVSARFPH